MADDVIDELASDAVRVKGAGEGSQQASNPLATFAIGMPTREEYDAVRGPSRSGAPGQAGDLLDLAETFVGTPYVWGGTSPNGFDCSGFTQYVFKQFGIDLPRISYQQGNMGSHIGIGAAKPGDLVFWDTSSRNNGADHVAIYLGNGMVIHAPKPGDAVKISPIWGNPWAVAMNL